MISLLFKRLVKRLFGTRIGRKFICWHRPKDAPVVAITFDDGPNSAWTPAVLDQLAKFGASATFFLQGSCVETNPELVQCIVAAGHEIGNHGYDHTRNDSPAQAVACDDVLRKHGIRTRCFRPPGGNLRIFDILWLVRAGYSIVLWSVDARDSLREEGKWKGPVPDYSQVEAGDIILMHDDNAICLQELPILLQVLQRKGLVTVTISQFLRSGSRG